MRLFRIVFTVRVLAVVCRFLAFLALCGFTIGCDDEKKEPIVWGECGPPQLTEPVPEGVFEALEVALEPGGSLERNGFHCEEGEETTFETPYRTCKLKSNATSPDPGDDFLRFEEHYRCNIACDGDYSVSAGVRLNELGWEVVSAGGGSQGYEDLDAQFSGTELPGCGRGKIGIDWLGRTAVIVTHEGDGTLIYPGSGLEWGDWGEEYAGMLPGEVAFTKEEFLEWCRQDKYLNQ